MLDLIWIAVFKDGSKIQQFEDIHEQKIEHTFKEVLDKQDELEQFILVSIKTFEVYKVDIKNGTISFGNIEPDQDQIIDSKYKCRLIYFRRVTRTFGLDLKEVGNVDIIYFLGYQYTDEQNRNHKRLMKIHKDGRLITN